MYCFLYVFVQIHRGQDRGFATGPQISILSFPTTKLLKYSYAAARLGLERRLPGMGREDPVRGSRASGEVR